jgi:cell division protein FtsI/penicillin-binding protein 2
MMVSAVEKGQMVKISGYTVAGKTGTAQVPDLEKGGYTTEVINSYIGFAPAYDARFVILVRLDRPEGAPLAGITVAPAFRELAQFMLNYYKVAPDKIMSGG